MRLFRPEDAARVKAWTHVKQAVRAYAKNPTDSTEQAVIAAVAEVRQCADAPLRRDLQSNRPTSA